MHKLAVGLTAYMLKNHVKEEAVREECEYGLELILNELLGSSIFFIVGIVLHRTIPVILITITFLWLRRRTGGFHMKNEWGCILVSVVTCIAALWISEHIFFQKPVVEIVISVISGMVIFLLAPLNHPNLNLSQKEMVVCRKAVYRRVFITLSVIGCSAWQTGNDAYVPYLVAGLGLDAGVLALGKIMGQEVKRQDGHEAKTVGVSRNSGSHKGGR